MTTAALDDRWMIALDIDGTVLLESGEMNDAVIAAVAKVRDAGHEVMLATGRSVAMTLPILQKLGLKPEYVVCSNGAITLKRDPMGEGGYSREFVEMFNPKEVLTSIKKHLGSANYAVEDQTGKFFVDGKFPDGALGAVSVDVSFDELVKVQATRVVVISPQHQVDDFLAVVERMGLHKVSYNVGWTAWLDIAPDGVNKSTALENVRSRLGIPRTRVLAMGDGRNDIDMLEWAARHGRGIAMGQAPDDVLAVASEVTESDVNDGAALVLAAFPSPISA
ncbi:HAD family hydrolase [Salinibacterium sp. PAMC 21357]|uniref:HAD family hydrolase n=1 Tax=Salinibacterium sp. PAMC 21357 TaxID=1112215 RepID=UPI000288BDAC|nr:HAD-IIB family hydrolase [Salinibacterium sp. PAMC 21357]